jgi:hypothetical protein
LELLQEPRGDFHFWVILGGAVEHASRYAEEEEERRRRNTRHEDFLSYFFNGDAAAVNAARARAG